MTYNKFRLILLPVFALLIFFSYLIYKIPASEFKNFLSNFLGALIGLVIVLIFVRIRKKSQVDIQHDQDVQYVSSQLYQNNPMAFYTILVIGALMMMVNVLENNVPFVALYKNYITGSLILAFLACIIWLFRVKKEDQYKYDYLKKGWLNKIKNFLGVIFMFCFVMVFVCGFFDGVAFFISRDYVPYYFVAAFLLVGVIAILAKIGGQMKD